MDLVFGVYMCTNLLVSCPCIEDKAPFCNHACNAVHFPVSDFVSNSEINQTSSPPNTDLPLLFMRTCSAAALNVITQYSSTQPQQLPLKHFYTVEIGVKSLRDMFFFQHDIKHNPGTVFLLLKSSMWWISGSGVYTISTQRPNKLNNIIGN